MAGKSRRRGWSRRPRIAARAAIRTAIVAGIAVLAAAGPAGPSWAVARSAMPGTSLRGQAIPAYTAGESGGPPGLTRVTHGHVTSSPASRDPVKYYVVQGPNHGHKEFLYEIAAKTLGNGNLASEIFRLNKGRLQPGGGRLENPAVIEPGWILVLPPSANGAGVHYGPLPAVAAPSASGLPGGPAARPPGHLTPGRPGFSGGQVALIGGAAALAAILLTGGLMVLAARRRVFARFGVVRAWDGGSAAAATGVAATAAPGTPATPAGGAAQQDAARAARGPLAAPAPSASVGAPSSTAVPLPQPTAVPPPQPADDPPCSTRPMGAAQADTAPVQRAPGGLTSLSPGPPGLVLPHPDHSAAQEHQVILGEDRIQVSLAEGPAADPGQDASGQRPPPSPHLIWTRLPYDTPDSGIAFACLGVGDSGCLFLDLGRAPSAITIGGDPAAAARLAESIAHQLCTTSAGPRCTVVIIGDALPRPHPVGITWLASVGRLGPTLATPGGATTIVFCELSCEDDATTLSQCVSTARGRVIPIVLGSDLAGRWSLTAWPSHEQTEPPVPESRP
jgi:hypothetical protein